MSSDFQLVIGEKNRSPWSLRAWLMLRQLGLPFDEVTVPLGDPDAADLVRHHSPTGRLPVLVAGGIRVWEALAIAEFLADHFHSLWPRGAEARATARAVSAEVHAGFRDLQTFLPMDFAARFEPPGRLLTPVAGDLRRVVEIWTACRARHGGDGPFLFGEFTAADAMFAPVCAQLATHSIPLDDVSGTYVAHVLGLPAMLEWAEGALAETGAAPPPPRPATPPPPRVVAGAAARREPEPEPAADDEPAREGDDGDDDDAPPAPGLPGVVPTRAYGDEPEPDAAGPGRRSMRPPAATGLFRWRRPLELPERIAGPDHAPPPPEPPPARPEPPQQPQPPPPPARPPEPAPARAEEERPPGLAPKPPAYAPRPPGPRPGTIKPIGDGTRRRR